VAGRRTVWTRLGSDLEWVGLGQSTLGTGDVVLVSVKPRRDLGESGGLAVGVARKSDDERLFGTPSASGDDLRGA
jgi:hypothetical protein